MNKNEIHKIIIVLACVVVLMGFTGCRNMVITGGEAVEDTENPIEMILPEITDLADIFSVILQGVSKEDIAGYTVDENFLMWLASDYGEVTIRQLAWQVIDDEMDIDTWYELTGSSIHVLWLLYCDETGFQSYQLENVLWMKCDNPNETIISFTGDINFAEDWYTMELLKRKKNGIRDCISSEVMEILQESDILFMNNEFVYSDSDEPLPEKAYTFRADLERVELLKELGADIVSLGNNHTYDYGDEGLFDTMEALDEANIAYVGAGANLKDACKIVYVVANGRKIAFVASTDIERTKQYTKAATETEAGVLKTHDPQHFVNVIKQAKRTSDYVIAVPHWGTEGTLQADGSQRRLANLFVNAGADVLIGGHPHRLQGVAYYGSIPVAYSLGNFWFSNGTLYTTVAQVVISEKHGLQLRFLPCEQKNLTTRLLTEKTEKDEFYHYLANISADVAIDAEGNVYNKKELSEEDNNVFPYDSATSSTKVVGGRDNDGYEIDIVGNRK